MPYDVLVHVNEDSRRGRIIQRIADEPHLTHEQVVEQVIDAGVMACDRQTGSADLASSDAGLDSLAGIYALTDESPTAEFLLQHPEVSHKLHEARPYIDLTWGPGAVVSLRHYSYPEDDGWRETLAAYVHTAADVDQTLEDLSAFNQRWWRDALRSASGLLSFDVERLNAI